VITEPTDIIENPLASEYSAISTRQELEQLFTIWKKSPSHQTQPLNPTHVRNQAFDFKPNLNFDDFIQNLQQNKKLILSGHFSQKLKEILKIPPKMGSNCEPDKEDFYWQAMLEDEDNLKTINLRDLLTNPLNLLTSIYPITFLRLLSFNLSTPLVRQLNFRIK
jgi:hypothetical protein